MKIMQKNHMVGTVQNKKKALFLLRSLEKKKYSGKDLVA